MLVPETRNPFLGKISIDRKGAHSTVFGPTRAPREAGVVEDVGDVEAIGTVSGPAALFTAPPGATNQGLPLLNARPSAPALLPSVSELEKRKRSVAGFAKLTPPGESV